MTEPHSPFEQGECPGQVALAKKQYPEPMRGIHESSRMGDHLGYPEPLFPKAPTRGKHAEFSIAHGEVGRGEHGR
jgi:hypothetical protein